MQIDQDENHVKEKPTTYLTFCQSFIFTPLPTISILNQHWVLILEQRKSYSLQYTPIMYMYEVKFNISNQHLLV